MIKALTVSWTRTIIVFALIFIVSLWNLIVNKNNLNQFLSRKFQKVRVIQENTDFSVKDGIFPELSYFNQTDPNYQTYLLEKYSPEVVFSSLGNILVDESENKSSLHSIISQSQRKKFSTQSLDACNFRDLLSSLNLAQNDRVAINQLYPNLNIRQLEYLRHEYNLSIDPVPLKRPKKSRELLIVYTTCNQLQMSVLTLQFLKNTENIADLVIIDDFSTDGTFEYLLKKGYAVISKSKATGLTDSWNIGYRLAVALGYKQVIFTNNDVLLTSGAVNVMHLGLRSHCLVVPLTSEKGAGHHKQQVRRPPSFSMSLSLLRVVVLSS